MNNDFIYIDKISAELEGAYLKIRNDLHKDASLSNSFRKRIACYGELIPNNPFNKKDEFFKWIRDNYPDCVNEQTGYHIHVSFKTIGSYEKLMYKKFNDYFLDHIEGWAKENSITNEWFWNRLHGQNKFCRKSFIPHKQRFLIKDREGIEERRTQLNYCWAMYKTLEFRLLPMFESVDTAISASESIIDCIESYLKKNPPDEVKVIEDEIVIEEKIDIKIPAEIIKLKPFNFYDSRGDKVKLENKELNDEKIDLFRDIKKKLNENLLKNLPKEEDIW